MVVMNYSTSDGAIQIYNARSKVYDFEDFTHKNYLWNVQKNVKKNWNRDGISQ